MIKWRWKSFEFKSVDMGGHFGLPKPHPRYTLGSVKWCQVYVVTNVAYPDGFELDHDVVIYIFVEREGYWRENSPILDAPRFFMSVRRRGKESVYEDMEFGPVKNWHEVGKNFVLLKRRGERGPEFIPFGDPVPIDYSGCTIARHSDVFPGVGWNRTVALVDTGNVREMIKIGLARYRCKVLGRV